jgi:hypothetical protein
MPHLLSCPFLLESLQSLLSSSPLSAITFITNATAWEQHVSVCEQRDLAVQLADHIPVFCCQLQQPACAAPPNGMLSPIMRDYFNLYGYHSINITAAS